MRSTLEGPRAESAGRVEGAGLFEGRSNIERTIDRFQQIVEARQVDSERDEISMKGETLFATPNKNLVEGGVKLGGASPQRNRRAHTWTEDRLPGAQAPWKLSMFFAILGR